LCGCNFSSEKPLGKGSGRAEKAGKVEGGLDLAKSVNIWKKAQYTDICRGAPSYVTGCVFAGL